MLDQYLIIHKSILPEYYEKVVKARHLIEDGKITEQTSHVFFPIDGFSDVNLADVKAAADELAAFLRDGLGLKVVQGFIDREPRSMEI